MWAWVSYLYNSILVIFIAAHLLVGGLIAFGVGLYTGIYLSQNYEIPKIDEPSKLWDKSIHFLERYKKNAGTGNQLSLEKDNDR